MVFFSLGLPLWHMEVPRLAVKLELPLLAWATATAMWDPSCVCDLHHSSQQCQILNPMSKARDRTATSWFLVGFVNHWATTGTPVFNFYMRYSVVETNLKCQIFLLNKWFRKFQPAIRESYYKGENEKRQIILSWIERGSLEMPKPYKP